MKVVKEKILQQYKDTCRYQENRQLRIRMRSEKDFNSAESWSVSSCINRLGRIQIGRNASGFPNMEGGGEEKKKAQLFLEINVNHVTQNSFKPDLIKSEAE